MSQAEVAARWVVSGIVQGVGFRWYVARHAQRLGLRGWVRNLPDGRVEVVAAGEGTGLNDMEERLRTGPRSATVEAVEKSHLPHEVVDANAFHIR